LQLSDPRQGKWLAIFIVGAVSATALRWHLGRDAPDGLPGGSQVGLFYGIAGGALILFAWLLSAMRYVPTWWWLGARAFWLKGHVWLGALSLVLILCHSGGRFGGPLEQALYAAFTLTVLTGMVGSVLQHFLPALLTRRLQTDIAIEGTRRVAYEVPYEQIPHVCRRLQEEADLQAKVLDAAPATARSQLEEFYSKVARPFLGWPSRERVLADPGEAGQVFARLRALPGAAAEMVTAALQRLEGFCAERRLLAEQERLHRWLHGWLYLHVPLSAAVMVLGVAHVVLTLYF
jgi:hypothetical protein